ncbi:MAG: hypothetical protein ACR2RL_22025 [Gammaproteobacteria bacterium]
MAIRFCVSNSNVSCVIPGIRTADQARHNAASCEPLPADILAGLIAN